MDIHITSNGGIDVKGWATVAVAALAFAASSCTGVIAFLVYKLNKKKLRLELYEKRFALYERLHKLVEKSPEIFAGKLWDYKAELHRCAHEAHFLLGESLARQIARLVDDLETMAGHNTNLADMERAAEAAGTNVMPQSYNDELDKRRVVAVAAGKKLIDIREALPPFLDFSKVGVEAVS